MKNNSTWITQGKKKDYSEKCDKMTTPLPIRFQEHLQVNQVCSTPFDIFIFIYFFYIKTLLHDAICDFYFVEKTKKK